MSGLYRVLVVDDDMDLNSTIAEELSRVDGFDAASAVTIAAAEAALLTPSLPISALLLDVRLPDGDGRDLCRRLRQTRANLPIILMSGLDEEDDVVKGLDGGADAYVVKPFSTSEIIARLKNLLPA